MIIYQHSEQPNTDSNHLLEERPQFHLAKPGKLDDKNLYNHS